MRRSSKLRSRIWPAAAYTAAILITLLRGALVTRNQAEIGLDHRQSANSPAKRSGESKSGSRPSKPLTHPKSWWVLVRETASGWSAHKAASLGAALAYYSIFSLGPLMVIAIAVAGLVLGADVVRGEVSTQIAGLLGEQGAQAIEGMLAGAGTPHEGILTTVLGVGTLLFAAIGVVVQLKDALNTVWEAKPPPRAGIWGFVRTYLVSLAGVVALGFLLLISLLLTTLLAALGTTLGNYLPETLLQAVSFIVSFAVISLLFAMMFKWLPDVKIAWRDVLPGAIVTAALFEIGKVLIGLYIGKQGFESTYGAAASIVVVLIWVYYSAQLVLFGGEFTRVYAHKYGSAVR